MPTSEELLEAPLLKLERAKHHIEDLNREIMAYIKERPVTLVWRQDPRAGERSLVIRAEKPFPPVLALIVGDAVHNLRSALDLAMYAVASSHRSTNREKIKFPFAAGPENFGQAIKEGQVKYAGEKVVAFVKSLNTYPGGNDLLCGLHNLSIRDKHRLLVGVARFPYLSFDEAYVIDPDMGSGLGRNGGVNFIPTGNVVYRYPMKGGYTARRKAKAFEEKAKIQPSISIIFADGLPFYGELIVPKLVVLSKRVEQVVRDLIEVYLDPDNTFPS